MFSAKKQCVNFFLDDCDGLCPAGWTLFGVTTPILLVVIAILALCLYRKTRQLRRKLEKGMQGIFYKMCWEGQIGTYRFGKGCESIKHRMHDTS